MIKKQPFKIQQFPNGVTLIGEEMDFVASAAFSILTAVGSATDPVGMEGSTALLTDMLHKGAGPWDSRQLSQEFENLGVQRSHSSGIEVTTFSGSMLGENLGKALELYAKVLREPRFPEEELESVRELALQDLKALEDEPSSKVMNELAGHYYPYPFGRSQLGNEQGILAVSIDSTKEYYRESFLRSPLIIAVAGNFVWDKVCEVIGRSFGDWQGTKERLTVEPKQQTERVFHIERDTSQVQIALAYPSVPIDHPDYYAARVATGILSGGMSGRLFIEVREKRGLVYRVSASHSAARGRAAIFASAGTTPENSEETLSVMLGELRRIKQDITDEELQRAKADIKSRVIMQSELSSIRSSALINDWWNLGSLRTLEEIKAGIDSVTAADIVRHAEAFPVHPVTLVTLGPKALELPK